MKHLIFFIWAIILTVIWFIIMIHSFIIRTLWDLNPNHYKFKYNPYYIDRSDIHEALSSYSDNYENYNYRTYFHYIWNIKSRNNEI